MSARWLVVSIWLLLGYAAWARGGTHVPLQGPLPWLGAMVLVVLFLVRLKRAHTDGSRTPWRAALAFAEDPVFWLGLAFLVLLGLQWWNAGRIRIFDMDANAWTYAPPRHNGFPSAITRGDAAEMLHWFFPVVPLLLAIRSGCLKRRNVRLLLTGLVVNAALLSAFGIVQFISGTKSVFWCQPLEAHFFASFGYANHAAAFFVLSLALSMGVFIDEIKCLAERAEVSKIRLAVAALASVLCFAGAQLSLSRIGMLFSWALVLLCVPYGMALLWRLLSPPQRINAIAGSLVGLTMLAFALAGPGHQAFLDLRGKWKGLSARLEGRGRQYQVRAAAEMLSTHPVFGVGGWGYRYLLPDYVSEQEVQLLGEGRANAHCDPMQFLAEFGAFGFALMTAVVVTLLYPLLRAVRPIRPLVFVPALGLGATCLHSLVDLPFRSPAILYHWFAVLAVLPLIISTPRAKGNEI